MNGRVFFRLGIRSMNWSILRGLKRPRRQDACSGCENGRMIDVLIGIIGENCRIPTCVCGIR